MKMREWKNTITEIKISMDGHNSRRERTEKAIAELENRTTQRNRLKNEEHFGDL